MTKTRYGWEVPVHSTTPTDTGTVLCLDFGNSCFGSLLIPAKGFTVPKRIRLSVEIEDAEPAPTLSE